MISDKFLYLSMHLYNSFPKYYSRSMFEFTWKYYLSCKYLELPNVINYSIKNYEIMIHV